MGHAHTPEAAITSNGAFKWAVGLNAAYVLVEAAAGFATNSLALLADAAHNLTDVAGLLIAWGAAYASRQPPTDRFSYGFGRATILAALANAIAILIAAGAVITEASSRFRDPVAVPAGIVILVAVLGIAINAGTASLFMRNRHKDLNTEGAFLHMAADAAVSGGVVLGAFAILLTGWAWLDPLVAILVSLFIAWTTFSLLRSALGLSLDAVPQGVDRARVETWLRSRPGVIAIHDLHIWPLSTTSVALTVHLVMPSGHFTDPFLEEISKELAHEFGINHSTIQVERGNGETCHLKPADVV